uniref:Uncharacterized protein n=1 Tax=Utricularia reniformis TaxID=192314 RepID=A0A1Y0B266_9LAMI|nr:hypothetical protein AEK19_MT1346 [Utricularia reniformis]ART31545.1 hypothetical protein AEK19_MT1346 [Utricularia reniformis]
MNVVYAQVYQCIYKYAESYEGDYIVRLMIRVYMDGLLGHRCLPKRDT